MYINNTKKLFEDLKVIPAMEDYMLAVKADGEQDRLSNLLSIVNCYKNNEGILSLECLDEEDKYEKKEIDERIEGAKKLRSIWKIIKKELTAKYVLKCDNCGDIFFYSKKPKYDIKIYQCLCKKIGTLKIIPFDEWATEEMKNRRRWYFEGGEIEFNNEFDKKVRSGIYFNK